MTNDLAKEFAESVLKLRPRVCVFDCDGTLWANNSGEDFFEWSMDQKLVSDEVIAWVRPRYVDYLAGNVSEEVMCGEMTTMYAGLTVATLESAAKTFFAEMVRPNIFPDMLDLTRKLTQQGCEIWAVSSTNEWVVREGIREFGILPSHVLAATAASSSGVITDQLTRMPSGEGKAVALREVVLPRHGNRPVDSVFGNSIHDAAMLGVAKHAFAVNPNPDLEELAKQKGWTVYWPVGTSAAQLR